MFSINKQALALLSACVLGVVMVGCGKETPAQTQADVSNAQTEGVKDVSKVATKANKNTMDAHTDVLKANAEMSHEAAVGEHDIAVAQAEAAHKVSIEKCEAMTGDARKACKKQADGDLDYAKLKADAVKRDTDPKR